MTLLHSMSSANSEGSTCFFYGTLMSPMVLSRVLYGTTELPKDNRLVIRAGKLADHSRHALKNLDYPAVVAEKDAFVLGTLASNLTAEEVSKLDVFEGDEYERRLVDVFDSESGKTIKANCYIWTAGEQHLETEDWDLSRFMKEKQVNWIADEMRECEGTGRRFWRPEDVAAATSG